jgi:glutaredoxin
MLEREGIEFSEKNVDDNESYREVVRQLGFQTVPVTTLRNNEGELVRVVSGFDPPGLGALKGLQAGQ